MGKAQRDKGKRGELELAHKINDLLNKYGACLDTQVQRSQQFSGKAGDADLRGLFGVYIECKRVERLNLHEAYAQAKADNKTSALPVVMFRRDRGEWMACLSLEDFMRMYAVIHNPPDEFESTLKGGFWQWLLHRKP